jgi:glucan-binding YG repeat protein
VIQKVGLIKVDGAYYYFSTTNGMMYKNGSRYVAQDCILHESVQGMKAGIYTFGADGKMVVEEDKNGIVGNYYYENGVIQKVGLIKIEGNYYYFSTTNGMMYKNGTRYVAQDCILHESVQGMKAGTYTFDADGKMVL